MVWYGMSMYEVSVSYNKSLCYFVDTTCNNNNRGDRRNIHFVLRHRQLVIKVIGCNFPQQNPDQYWRTLALMSSTMQQNDDPPIVEVIKNAGKEWLSLPVNAHNCFKLASTKPPTQRLLSRGRRLSHRKMLKRLLL